MADQPDLAATTGLRDKIVSAAKSAALAYQNSTYLLGGKSTTAFDCSYFVYLVFHEVFPAYQYMDSSAITSNPSLFVKSASPKGGDIIFFPKGAVPYAVEQGETKEFDNHVGIVLDSAMWVGRQSSKLGSVLFANPWWASRERQYYSYTSFDSATASASSFDMLQYFA